MLKALVLLFAGFLLLPVPAKADDNILMVDLADAQVSITTGFSGARLSLFGYKAHQGNLAITITGPKRPMVVRKKEPLFGLWMNRDAMKFIEVPVYYDYASSKPVSELASPETLQKHVIGLKALDFVYTGREEEATVSSFREALIRNKQIQGFYPLEPKKVIFLNNDFFRVNFRLPADVPTGNYMVRTFLFDDGRPVDIRETQLRIAQVGFNAAIYKLAHGNEMAYALAAVVFAVFAGWAGYIVLRRE